MPHYRPLLEEELNRALFAKFIRRQSVCTCWRRIDGRWQLRDDPFIDDWSEEGYFDRLFVHRDYQRRGIATALCDALESAAPARITTHASITARPFFESRGYRVIRQQQVLRKGVLLTNYTMEKQK